jgi:hypothetical protein
MHADTAVTAVCMYADVFMYVGHAACLQEQLLMPCMIMCVCKYIYVCMYVRVYSYKYICMHVWYVCMCVCPVICLRTNLQEPCLYVCMHVCCVISQYMCR